MKYLGPISKDLKGPGADDYLAQARVLLGQVRADMQLGGVKQGWRSYDMPNGTKIRVYSNHNGAVPMDKVWIITSPGDEKHIPYLLEHGLAEGIPSAYTELYVYPSILAAGKKGLAPLEIKGTLGSTVYIFAADYPALVGGRYKFRPSIKENLLRAYSLPAPPSSPSLYKVDKPQYHSGLTKLLCQSLLGVGRLFSTMAYDAGWQPIVSEALPPGAVHCIRAPNNDYWLVLIHGGGIQAVKMSPDKEFVALQAQAANVDIVANERDMFDAWVLAYCRVPTVGKKTLLAASATAFSTLVKPEIQYLRNAGWGFCNRFQKRGAVDEYTPNLIGRDVQIDFVFDVETGEPNSVTVTQLQATSGYTLQAHWFNSDGSITEYERTAAGDIRIGGRLFPYTPGTDVWTGDTDDPNPYDPVSGHHYATYLGPAYEEYYNNFGPVWLSWVYSYRSFTITIWARHEEHAPKSFLITLKETPGIAFIRPAVYDVDSYVYEFTSTEPGVDFFVSGVDMCGCGETPDDCRGEPGIPASPTLSGDCAVLARFGEYTSDSSETVTPGATESSVPITVLYDGTFYEAGTTADLSYQTDDSKFSYQHQYIGASVSGTPPEAFPKTHLDPSYQWVGAA